MKVKNIPHSNYQLTSLGQLINTKTKRVLAGGIKPEGYKICIINIGGVTKTRYIHRLVAELFIPNPLKLKEVNHKDGNRLNNSVENLEWVSRSQNMKEAFGRTPAQKKVVIQSRIDSLEKEIVKLKKRLK